MFIQDGHGKDYTSANNERQVTMLTDEERAHRYDAAVFDNRLTEQED
jgi:hypothetical protein